VEGLLDVFWLQVWESVDDVSRRHAISDHVDDGGHGDPETTNARQPTHLAGVCSDAIELHGVLTSRAFAPQ
jgi:hypothetical protein